MTTVEPMRAEHIAFVLDAWRKGTREYARRHGEKWLASEHNAMAEDVMRDGVLRVAIVDGAYAGWIAARPSDGHVYYVYVKKSFRGWGIARKLYASVNPSKEQWTTYAKGFHVQPALYDRYHVRLLS